MALSFTSKLAGLVFGSALAASLLPIGVAQASPFGAVGGMRTETALPMIDVQQRVQQRRPVRRAPVARKRNNNGAVVAGALVGAAIIGGAIIANSQRQRQPQYYYGAPGYPPDYYRRPQPYYGGPAYYEPAPVYRRPRQQPTYYYPQQRPYVGPNVPTRTPGYYRNPQTRQGEWDKTRWSNDRQNQYGQPGVIATPDRETPYTYAPAPQQPRRRGIFHVPN